MPVRIVIVGRPNVGKSSLLNMLAGRRISIVDPTAGVTRDRIAAMVEIPSPEPGGEPLPAEMIDTGGYGIEDVQHLTAEVEAQITRGLAQADLVLFVVDAQSGITPLDETVAKVLRAAGPHRKPVVLVANKVDSEKYEPHACEAASLGFGEPVMISATTGYRKYDLIARIHESIDPAVMPADDEMAYGDDADVLKLAIIGKRNAGKSTLVNALVGDDRVIVSDQEGTTRDAVDVPFTFNDRRFIAIDTAGVRKRKSIKQDIEYYSHHRALRSIRRADVCLLLIDAAVPVSQVDKQLAGEVQRHYRPAVVVVNKWDLAERDYTQESYIEYLDRELRGLNFSPLVFISAKNGEGLAEILAMADNLHQQATHRVGTGELNQVMEQIMAERGPSSKGGRRAKVYYITQPQVDPPTLVLFVNQPDLFDNNYQRFMLNRLRDVLPYAEVPIKLIIRGREAMKQGYEGDRS